MARLFFALWPDDALRRQIAAQAVALNHAHEGGGRLLPQDRLHLTLRFMGEYPDEAFAHTPEAFVPHVTFLRDAVRELPATPIAPLAWRVRGFALVESHPGQAYRTVHHWGG